MRTILLSVNGTTFVFYTKIYHMIQSPFILKNTDNLIKLEYFQDNQMLTLI